MADKKDKEKEPELTELGMIAGPPGQRDRGRTVFEDEKGALYIKDEDGEKPEKV